MQQAKGFTLVELLVTIAIIGILSAVVLFSVIQYINSSKDASVRGNLSVLVTAGEVYYNTNQDSYQGFCGSSVVVNALLQIPHIAGEESYCSDIQNEWAACSHLFIDNRTAYCVDSRGVQREICNNSCTDAITVCPEKADPCP